MWFLETSPQDFVVLLGIAVLTAGLALTVLLKRPAGSEAGSTSATSSNLAPAPQPVIAYLFDGEELSDCTPAGRRILDIGGPGKSDLARVVDFFTPRFPGLAEAVSDAGGAEPSVLVSQGGSAQLSLRRDSGSLRITLTDNGRGAPGLDTDPQVVSALLDALDMHRQLTNGLAFPMWRQTSNGMITWTNAEYRALETALSRDDIKVNRNRHIFGPELDFRGDTRRIHRAKLEFSNAAEPRWFEFQVAQFGEDLLIAAVPVDRVVRAERSLSGFVQTLTQTFAHLNVGLAVFNRNRELVIFNPALTELLQLSPEFLVTRPTIFQVFDRLREQRMVPEQRDYASWRRKMAALEAAASDTEFSETWSLLEDRTFRVTGRPHPEGAVAFLFEDISNEIALERKFRAELQMGHAVIDGLDEAIAVFSPAGTLTLSNKAYRDLWFDGAAEAAVPVSFVESTRAWQHQCMPTPIWGDARDFAGTIGERTNWTAEVRQTDGAMVECRFDALAGGYTLAGFRRVEDAGAGSGLDGDAATPHDRPAQLTA